MLSSIINKIFYFFESLGKIYLDEAPYLQYRHIRVIDH